MFGKKEFDGIDKFDTLIGASSVFEGNIKSDGTIRIDGKVIGDLAVNGDIYIGSEASVKGNINANNIHNAGTVDGNIEANGILRLLSTSKINGDITVQSFIADEGGVFNGKCTMKDAKTNSK
ncbi:MAG TPA: polymer-forming cytoskeletal protein [Pseudobacteroides sp.]|uniref:bactofilin family protein n=1 Tax=Pseudobacteroides sp. TaxID=1968840 RepID=UPI002F947FC3